jgi:2-polyprenyl-6-methoxyphenol hydroxylase-like FAD-dependent oxidoreductase
VLYTPCSETQIYVALTMLHSDEVAKAMPLRKDAWKTWFPHLAPLIDRLGDDGRYDRFEYIRLKKWSSGRVAVIGDAAHALPPNIGQGAGCAMMNALALAVFLGPGTRHAYRVNSLGTAGKAGDRSHPEGVAISRHADVLAIPAARAVLLAGRTFKMDDPAAHAHGTASSDGDVNFRLFDLTP